MATRLSKCELVLQPSLSTPFCIQSKEQLAENMGVKRCQSHNKYQAGI